MHEEPVKDRETGMASALQEMILESADVAGFLDRFAAFSAQSLSLPGNKVSCGITLMRERKPVTVASSDPEAREMDEVQYAYGDGPCLTALRDSRTILVPDLVEEQCWPDYVAAVLSHGVRSMLAVPLTLKSEAKAALNFYATRAHGFSENATAKAESFAAQASGSLDLALGLAKLNETRHDLTAALASRSIIDMAIGVIMAQNRCTQEEAFHILQKASSARNIKLRDLAASIVASVGGTGQDPHP